MSPIIRNFQALLLPCLVIVLTGCQHSLSPEVAQQRAAAVGHPIFDARATAHLQKVMFTRDSMVKPVAAVAEVRAPETPHSADATDAPDATTPKESQSLTLQLGDCLLAALKTLTGH